MREFVIGDIHGGYKGLIQVLQRSNFDYEKDKLVVLGDVADGWPDVAECIEELLKIKNLILCRGNHDDWAVKGLTGKLLNRLSGIYMTWYEHGGSATISSYDKNPELSEKHIEFLNGAVNYYLDDKNRLFLHAGFDDEFPIDEQSDQIYFWDRDFWRSIKSGFTGAYTNKYIEIYIGHTPTIFEWVHGKPVNINNVWNMDTGATYVGKLSMMDINTKDIFQSDPVFLLYPDHKGRNGSFLAKDPNWNVWGLFPGEDEYVPKKYKE